MERDFHFKLGIVCVNCVSPVQNALDTQKVLSITNSFIDVTTKTLTLKVNEPEKDKAEIVADIKSIIEEIGVDCNLIDNAETTNEITPHETNLLIPKQIKKKKFIAKNPIRNHLLKAFVGIGIGIGLIIFNLLGLSLPLFAMYGLVGYGSLITISLGKESFIDATKKLIKSRTLTMDTLFTVSALTVIGVSIASFFFPWLPMMIESGLLIFGFRHLGQAVEESLTQKVNAELTFNDRAAKIIEKKHEADSWEKYSSAVINPGDVIRVKAGETIPVDGCSLVHTIIHKTIIDGSMYPSEIQPGDEIVAGMRVPENVSFIEMIVSKPMALSYLTQLDKKIAEMNAKKVPIEITTTNLLQYFIPSIILLACLSGIIIGLLYNPPLAIQCATSVLVTACPCTLGLITPFAIKIGIKKALDNGVLFKNGKSIQIANQIDTVIFDLHGTLTIGNPTVDPGKIFIANEFQPHDFFHYLFLIEQQSPKPIAKSIVQFCKNKIDLNKNLTIQQIDLSNHSGVKAIINDEICLVGNRDFLSYHGFDLSAVDDDANKTYLVKAGKLMGWLNTTDPLKPGAKEIFQQLQTMGKNVYICSGGDAKSVNDYARELKISPDHVFTNCLPTDKTRLIENLQQQGKKVAMIGDAGNDVLALKKADLGIAIKSIGADVLAQQEAKVIIDSTSLLSVVTTFAVANETIRCIKQNLAFSLLYNTTMILIAGGILVGLGFALNPGVGVALMVLQQISLMLFNHYRIKHKQFAHLKTIKPVDTTNQTQQSTYLQLYKARILGRKKQPLPNPPHQQPLPNPPHQAKKCLMERGNIIKRGHLMDIYVFLRKAISASVDSRPNNLLRCGNRPNSFITRK